MPLYADKNICHEMQRNTLDNAHPYIHYIKPTVLLKGGKKNYVEYRSSEYIMRYK